MQKSLILAGLVSLSLLSVGCVTTSSARDKYGKTYYIDGAGNWGFGVGEVARGLKSAGYPGSVEAFMWTTSFNPALDQVNRPAARLRALDLSAKISDYLKRYPDNEVNVIALSAGTGVATWAIENLKPGQRVNNFVMLGSSLSSDYDMTKAFGHIRGGIYVYHSPHDAILDGPVRMLGTIDGKMGVDAAGLVGLRPGGGRITNVAWSPQYERYGWTGAHTDCTSERFVKQVLSSHVMTEAVTKAARHDTSQAAADAQPDQQTVVQR